MRVLIKVTQPTIFALLLMGCAHSVEPSEPLQDKTITKLTPNPSSWHDGSKGGDYGIGEGWSIELLPAEYETVFDVVTLGHPTASSLISIPAEYEWVKDNRADQSDEPIMVRKLVTTPAEFMTITENIVLQPKSSGYYLTDTTYHSDGSIGTPKTVKLRVIPAEVRQVERRVMKTPARTIERMVPVERRKGYRRVVKNPAKTAERPWDVGPYYKPRKVEAQPWRFLIRKPIGEIVYVFDDFDNLTAFTDSLKQ